MEAYFPIYSIQERDQYLIQNLLLIFAIL